MEKKLIKTLIYSFVLALFIAIIYFPDRQNISNIIIDLTMREYIFKVIRFSIKISLASLFVVWIFELVKTPKSNGYDFIKGITKSFAVSFILFIIISLILGFIFRA